MSDHRSAQRVLQMLVTGATVPERELDEALAHVASCDECAAQFEVSGMLAWTECEEEPPAMDDMPIDPEALFERALSAALDDPDPMTRLRAAERLGERTASGPATLAALIRIASDDAEERVRAAASAALDRLGVGVAELTNPMPDDQGGLTLTSEEGARGHIAVEDSGVWMTVDGLPQRFDNTKPWVAFPRAFEERLQSFVAAGGDPGFVEAANSVQEGSARVLLGGLTEARGTEPEGGETSAPTIDDYADLFERVYLFDTRRCE